MSKRTQTMFAIAGKWSRGKEFLYSGVRYQRQDAVREHCENLGKTWAECREKGDRAVKVTVTWDDRA